jgi:hypothetical protein
LPAKWNSVVMLPSLLHFTHLKLFWFVWEFISIIEYRSIWESASDINFICFRTEHIIILYYTTFIISLYAFKQFGFIWKCILIITSRGIWGAI